MSFDAPKILPPGFFVLFTLGIFASICPANAQSQGDHGKTSPARQSPTEKRGLDFSFGPSGLDSLSFNGQFEKFRAAGLRVGVCIRPQQIAMVEGKPVHQAADDEHAAQILRERIAYAKQR